LASKFAFKFNLYRYTAAAVKPKAKPRTTAAAKPMTKEEREAAVAAARAERRESLAAQRQRYGGDGGGGAGAAEITVCTNNACAKRGAKNLMTKLLVGLSLPGGVSLLHGPYRLSSIVF
jgi:hypothetical protein